MDEQLRGLQSTWSSLCTDSKAKIAAIENSIKAVLDEITARRETVAKDLTEFQKTVETAIALQAPVQHWQNLAAECNERAKTFGIAFVCMLVASVLVLSIYVYNAWPKESAQPVDKFWAISSLLLLAGAVTWPLRLLAKLTMSNVHLSADATERAVTIMAYLALLKESNAIAEEDKKIVLATIFRTAATGIVHDDGAPSGGLELLSKLFK